MNNRKRKERLVNTLLFIVGLLAACFFAMPFIYMI